MAAEAGNPVPGNLVLEKEVGVCSKYMECWRLNDCPVYERAQEAVKVFTDYPVQESSTRERRSATFDCIISPGSACVTFTMEKPWDGSCRYKLRVQGYSARLEEIRDFIGMAAVCAAHMI